MGTKGEVQGRGGRSVEVGGGDLGGGEGEGESWRHLFLFSPATCLFWVFPSQFPNKGKNAQIQKKRPKVEYMTPFFLILSVATREMDLMREVGWWFFF